MAIELIEKRRENTKTYDVGGNKRQLVASIGAIHYKDNYADQSESWKDIDLTWLNNRIDKAPYILVRDGNKITVTDKKTGDVSTIELTSVKPAGLAFEIVPETTRISFRHTLPTDKIPFEAQFKVTGKNIATKAFDDDGELVLDTTLVGDVLTEKLSEVKDKQTGQVRPAKGQIKIDPTWQVAASTDDAHRRLTTSYFSLTLGVLIAGAQSTTNYQVGGGMRFLNITIPNAQVIDSAYLILTTESSRSTSTVNTRISAEDVDDAVTFADDAAAFDTRWAARTTARVDWDNIGAWTLNAENNSPEIKTVIQEIVDRVGWASGNDIVIFWEDFEDRSTHATSTWREAWSYNGSTTKAPKLVVTYTVPAAPTVTTQAVSGVGNFSATGNGNITATGGANATRRGFCYVAGTSGDPTVANSVVYDDGDFGTGAYTKVITGLTDNTGYRVRAYAINSVGTSYGTTVQLTTGGSRPASVFMDNTLVTLVAGSLSLDNRIEERSTASFTIIDLTAALSYQRGQVVEVYSGETATPTGTLLFAGFIETPDEVRDGNGLLHTIQCKDNHYLADKRLVVKSYADKTLAFIVNDIITDYLAAEGITAGTIQTGPTISEAIFNYVKASECFDALKELSGFLWQINEDKTLDFIERNTNLAPWALTTTEMVDGSAHLSTGNPAYRNRQYIRGGTGLTGQQTENFTGDAVVKAFTVGYPLSLVPTSVKVNAVTQTIGIKGIDTGKDCYWNKGDATITFDAAPGNGLNVEVVYYGQYPLIVRADRPADIAARLAVEGGTGIVEEIVHEAQHESADAMRESASAKLQRYCQDAEKFSFQTRTSGLKSGQLLTVTYAPFGFASYDMLIESVKIAEEDSAHLIYSVVAITGPALGSWSKFFANILARQDKSIKIGDSLLLVLLQAQETLSLTEVGTLASDEFAVSGNVNRWLNSAPITSGSLQNVQHERLEMSEVGSLSETGTEDYSWQ